MKAICTNNECENGIHEVEFEVKNLETGACPECGSRKLAPAWTKNYRLPGEKELRKKQQAIHELLKKKEAVKK